MRFLALFDHDAHRLAFLIQLEPDLRGREIDGAFAEPLFAQPLGDVVQEFDLGLVEARLLFDDLLYLFISEPVIAVDHGAAKPGPFHLPFGVIRNTAEKVSLSSCGRSEQSSLEIRSGNMGLTRSG